MGKGGLGVVQLGGDGTVLQCRSLNRLLYEAHSPMQVIVNRKGRSSQADNPPNRRSQHVVLIIKQHVYTH